jgi:hypothetical protein
MSAPLNSSGNEQQVWSVDEDTIITIAEMDYSDAASFNGDGFAERALERAPASGESGRMGSDFIREPLSEIDFQSRLNSDTRIVVDVFKRIFESPRGNAPANTRKFIAKRLRVFPPMSHTRIQIAFHEAGHYVASEATGMMATFAEIRGSNFGRGGWSGFAQSANSLLWTPIPYVPSDLIHEAAMRLAGPWAEYVLGDGDFYSSLYEVFAPYGIAYRVAQMRGQSTLEVLTEVIQVTVAIVDGYRTEIEEIAGQLERRKRVNLFERSTSKVLKQVQAKALHGIPKADEAHVSELTQMFNNALSAVFSQ